MGFSNQLETIFWLYLMLGIRKSVKAALQRQLLSVVGQRIAKVSVVSNLVLDRILKSAKVPIPFGIDSVLFVNLGVDFFVWAKLSNTMKSFIVLSSTCIEPNCSFATELFSHNLKIRHNQKQNKIVTLYMTSCPVVSVECRIAPIGIKTTCEQLMVEQFFSKNIIVSPSDYLCISSCDKTFCSSQNTCEKFYFKVVDAGFQNKTFFVTKSTRLYTVPAIYETLPPVDKRIVCCERMSLLKDIPVVPYGLENQFSVLTSITRKYFTQGATSLTQPNILIEGPRKSGKHFLTKCLSVTLGLLFETVNLFEAVSEKSGSTEALLDRLFATVGKVGPTLLLLENLHEFGRHRETGQADRRVIDKFISVINSLNQNQDQHVLVIAIVEASDKCLSEITQLFRQKIAIKAPSLQERAEIIRWICEENSVEIEDGIASKAASLTSGFVFGDINAAVSLAIRERGSSWIVNHNTYPTLESDALLSAIDKVKSWQTDALGFPKIPSVRWDDIGGLEGVRQQILDMIQFSARNPRLAAAGIRQFGLLMWGPPGTGKTLVAKAVATECSLHFLSVKGPELLNMYVGQSEENVREIFRRARAARPCLVFFDELDSLAPNRGQSGDSGGVMDRVVSQLLAELDSLSTVGDVFLLGATNRPDLIDPSLLRPGRFDKKVYLGLSSDVSSKAKVLKALTRKFVVEEGLNWETLAEELPANTSGADLYALVTDALFVSINRRIDGIQKDLLDERDPIRLTEPDFLEAVTRFKPSVSLSELKMYQSIRDRE